ncbi:MAG: hypothetical protein KI790_04845 [Cyclobacteriaceae bacterium]|nr:hypothetical protein [Cyclobacteriaceae bacterium HetDA_MAG_MS6]
MIISLLLSSLLLSVPTSPDQRAQQEKYYCHLNTFYEGHYMGLDRLIIPVNKKDYSLKMGFSQLELNYQITRQNNLVELKISKPDGTRFAEGYFDIGGPLPDRFEFGFYESTEWSFKCKCQKGSYPEK